MSQYSNNFGAYCNTSKKAIIKWKRKYNSFNLFQMSNYRWNIL